MDVTETTETTELLDPPAPEDATPASEPEPERPSPAEARIQELTGQVRRLEETLGMTQQMQREQLARTQPGDPKIKEFAEHPYTAYLAQQVQAAVIPVLDQTDRINAELQITKKFGEDVWDQVAEDVEREHQAYLSRGQWAEREKLVYVVAGQKGIKLEPKAQRRESEQRATRARGARSAAVETATPARRADSTPAPPLHTMDKAKRDAALDAYLAKAGGF